MPAIFATLASGSFVFGYVRSQLIAQDATPVPPDHWIEQLGRVRFADVPVEVFFFAALAFLAFLFLRFTKWGRYIYLMGDNFLAARNMGIPVAPDDRAALCDLGADRLRRRPADGAEPASASTPGS